MPQLVENKTAHTLAKRVSAVIITKNEELHIGRCIDSLQGVVDEIVVVDSFSTDRTREICVERGVKFIQHPFEGHIQQKNYALSQTEYQHVLSLDADEALDDTLRASILEVKQNWQKDGYAMNRVTQYGGQWIWYGSWYPDRKLRLWDKTKGQWGGMNPHDKFILEPGTSVQRLKGNLLHYSFQSVGDHVRQMNYLSEISARSYYESGRKASWWRLVLSPFLAFVKSFFLKMGFLCGYYGFVIAMIDAHFTFIKYVKLREIKKQSEKNTSFIQ